MQIFIHSLSGETSCVIRGCPTKEEENTAERVKVVCKQKSFRMNSFYAITATDI